MATRIFLKLGDIKGSSKDDKKHTDWIELTSFGFGLSNNISSVEKAKGNPGGEASHLSDVSLTKVVDKTSPLLLSYCSAGKVFSKAEIECNEEAELLMKMTLTNAAIANVSIGGGTGGVPVESLSLAYSKIVWQYKTDAEQHWDQVTNTGSLKKK
jgi:type VI secretion system secreted protein Hcp